MISIHALREEGDCARTHGRRSDTLFLSTPSARRATASSGALRVMLLISIHALREEGDRRTFAPRFAAFLISIHALREEGDPTLTQPLSVTTAFLSTPSARRATFCCSTPNRCIRHFYPRPPRGGRQGGDGEGYTGTTFLSTPSARRATWRGLLPLQASRNFYPRPPRGGRLRRGIRLGLLHRISIHALREEGDSKNGEKHLRFCFIIKRSAQIWKSLSKNIRKNSCDLHRTA